MSHEVYSLQGQWSMAFTGDVPWHGLGQRVNPDASVEEWRRAANLEWSVREAAVKFNAIVDDPVIGQQLSESSCIVGNRKVLYRSLDGAPLGVVGPHYKVVQPAQILEFFRALVEANGFKIHTAGSLRDGKRVWVLAEVPIGFKLSGGDHHRVFVLLVTSYDKSMSTTCRLTIIRVVCNNTLEMAVLGGGESIVRVPHNQVFDPVDLRIQMGFVDEGVRKFAADMDALSKRRVTRDEAIAFFTKLLVPEEGVEETVLPKHRVAALMRDFEGGRGQDTESAAGTAFGLVTAVTLNYDHHRFARNTERRLDSAWFGPGRDVKRRALETALELVQ